MYKRQTQDSLNGYLDQLNLQNRDYMIEYVTLQELERRLRVQKASERDWSLFGEIEQGTGVAVSYTHLDVYKRQPFPHDGGDSIPS